MRNNLVKLMGEKQAKSGEIVNLVKVSSDAGIRHHVLARWAKQEVTRFDESVVERLCRYFKCSVGDLLYVVDDDDQRAS